MKKFCFKATNEWLVLLRLLATITIVVFCSFLFYTYFFRLTNKFIFITVFVSFFLMIYFLLKKISLIDVHFEIANNKMLMTTKFLFLEAKLFKFEDNEVINYSNEYVNGYDVFKIRLKNGKKIRFLIEDSEKNIKVYLKFYKVFGGKVTILNNNAVYQKRHRSNESIKNRSLSFAIIILIILILIPILYVFFNRQINWYVLIILYPPSLIYVYKVFIVTKRRK